MAEKVVIPEFKEEWLTTAIDYPETDGEPVAESDFQLVWLLYVIQALRLFFTPHKDVYVAGNLLVYYKEGDVSASVAPDIFVVRGIENRMRRSYKVWEEGKVPDFVLEITSKSTVDKDQGIKWGLYRYLGVQEYFMFDPTADYLEPQLQGYHLVEGNYDPLTAVEKNNILVLHSRVLGLDLQLVGNELRFYDAANDRVLPTYQEMEQARLEAERQAEETAAAHQAALSRIAELEAQLRALKEDKS